MFTQISRILTIFFFMISPLNAQGPEVVKLAEDVYAFVGIEGGTNSGFVVTDEGVVVIDTQGPQELALLLKKKIQEITDKPILYVINTHYHGDHTFGNQYFKEAKEIISHENTKKNLIEKDKPHKEQFKRFFGEKSLEGFEMALPTKTIKNSFTIKAGSRKIELKYLGKGHTDGDIIVYLPKEHILFAGDLLYKNRLPWLGDAYTADWIETLKKLKGFDADIYIPGHGPIGDKVTVSDLQQYLTDLRAEIKRLVKQRKTLDEIKKEIDLPKYKDHLKYKDWLPLNAEKVYKELSGR